MQGFPHHYVVEAKAEQNGNVALSATGLPPIESAPPVEFDGPGDRWSPESLLVAAVADCLVLTFRAIASASRLEWTRLSCTVEGTLDKADGKPRFTAFTIKPRLEVPAGTDAARAERLLEKAEQSCLITNSLTAEKTLAAEVVVTA